MKKKQVAIIHFNTPELTEAAILSLRKHGGEDYEVTVFDNSTATTDEDGNTIKARPFKKKMKGVARIDNTKGQVIDFDEFLAGYPDREAKYAALSDFGSAKHIRTIEELWVLLPDGFVLMESDILIKKDIDWMFDEDRAAVGKVQWKQRGNKFAIPRYLPHLLYMNVRKLRKAGVHFFDDKRCWALQKGENTRGNWYDTGASLLEDIRRGKPALVGRNVASLTDYYDHYQGGSWRKNDVDHQKAWLKAREELYK